MAFVEPIELSDRGIKLVPLDLSHEAALAHAAKQTQRTMKEAA